MSVSAGARDTETTDQRNYCTTCRREVELCAFCEREGCDVAWCYLCMAVALRESRRPLHDHGG